MSIKIEQAPDAVQDLHEAFHVIPRPTASVLALVAALTEPDLPADARGRLKQAEWLADVFHAFMPASQGTGRPYGRAVWHGNRPEPAAREWCDVHGN